MELGVNYDVKVNDENLVLSHPRVGEFELVQELGTGRLAGSWIFDSVQFEQASPDCPHVMLISYGRARQLVFHNEALTSEQRTRCTLPTDEN
jgi:hypothetical protein